jgi:hypothetical protein
MTASKEEVMLDYLTANQLEHYWEFDVEMQPVFDQHGEPIKGSQHVVRTDTNQSLGVHGSRYKMVRHDDVVNSILDSVSSANLSNDYDINVKVLEDGRKLRGEILFNDLVIEPDVGDYVQFKVDFFNSYDASWSMSQAASGNRLWCKNGCTIADLVARTRYKHTTSINLEGSAAKIASGLNHFMSQKEVWQSYMQTTVTTPMVEKFFKKTVAKAFTRQTQVTKTNEKQLEKLLEIWGNEHRQLGRNKWALYNCLTYWATHTQELRSPHTARYNREAAIASAMRSKHWEFANYDD